MSNVNARKCKHIPSYEAVDSVTVCLTVLWSHVFVRLSSFALFSHCIGLLSLTFYLAHSIAFSLLSTTMPAEEIFVCPV